MKRLLLSTVCTTFMLTAMPAHAQTRSSAAAGAEDQEIIVLRCDGPMEKPRRCLV